MRLSAASGTAKLGASGGNIIVGRVLAGADLETSGGDIKIGSIESFVHASTSGGNVTVDSIASLKGDSDLETSGGNVRVGVSSTLACNLNATTNGGEVKAEGVTITTDQGGSGRNKLIGKVNGGRAGVETPVERRRYFVGDALNLTEAGPAGAVRLRGMSNSSSDR